MDAGDPHNSDGAVQRPTNSPSPHGSLEDGRQDQFLRIEEAPSSAAPVRIKLRVSGVRQDVSSHAATFSNEPLNSGADVNASPTNSSGHSQTPAASATSCRMPRNPSPAEGNEPVSSLEFSMDGTAMPPPARLANGGTSKRASSGSMPAAKKSKVTAAKPRRLAKETKDDAFNDLDKVLGDIKSPLYDADTNISAILQHPVARAHFSSTQDGSALADVSSVDLNRATTEFKEDGRSGRHDEDWLRNSLEATSNRAAGEYDSYHQDTFAATWGETKEELSDSEEEKDNDVEMNVPPSNHRPDDDEPPAPSTGEPTPDASNHDRWMASLQPQNGHTPAGSSSRQTNGHSTNSSQTRKANVHSASGINSRQVKSRAAKSQANGHSTLPLPAPGFHPTRNTSSQAESYHPSTTTRNLNPQPLNSLKQSLPLILNSEWRNISTINIICNRLRKVSMRQTAYVHIKTNDQSSLVFYPEWSYIPGPALALLKTQTSKEKLEHLFPVMKLLLVKPPLRKGIGLQFLTLLATSKRQRLSQSMPLDPTIIMNPKWVQETPK